MELPAAQTVPASKLQFIFRNDRGLRAGWRLLIFAGMTTSFFMLVRLLLSVTRGAQPRTPQNVIDPWPQLFVGVFVFLAILFFTWVMSRIERRPTGVYGLPLNRSVWKSFFSGWLFWGVLPLTVLLLVMRALGVFYFGTIALRGADMIRFALLWGAVFLLVGLVEEYTTRGYALFTLTDGIGFWPAAILQALVFGWGHMGNPGETRIGIVDATLFAMFAAVTLRFTGDLWLAVGAHAGWDWAQSYLYGVNDSGAPAVGHFLNSHSQGPPWLSGGTVGPEGSVLSSLMMMAMTAAFIALYHKGRRPEFTTNAENSSALPPFS